MSTHYTHDELRAIEERLTARLESLAPQPAADSAAHVRAAVASTAQRRGPIAWLRWRLSFVAWREGTFAAAVVVLAVAVGVGIGQTGLLGIGRSSGSPQSSAGVSSASASVVASAEPTPGLAPADIYQAWDRTELPQGSGQAHGNPHGIVEFNGTMIVVGGAETGGCQGQVPCVEETTAAVWRSDGSGWHRLPDTAGLRAGAMRSAAAATNRLLVLGDTTFSPKGTGEGNFWPELWVSSDGETFTAYDAPADFTAIAAVDSGFATFVAAASTDAGPEIWSSADGVRWTRVANATALGTGTIRQIRFVGSEGIIVAVGSDTTESPTGTSDSRGVVWTSQGGQLWSRYAGPPLAGGTVNDVAALGSHLVAVGSTGDLGTGLVWTSEDAGASWHRVDRLQLLGRPLGAVQSVPDGYVALGGGPGVPILVSLSGERWDEVPAQADLSGDPSLEGIALQAETGELVAAGSAQVSGTPVATVWTSNRGGASSSASPSASITASTVFATWARAVMPDPTPHVHGGEWARAVVEFKGAYYAFGFINGGCCDGGYSTDTRALVWRSLDATGWAAVPNQAAFAEGRMNAAAADGTRIVVVGTLDVQSAGGPADHRGAAWTSTDGMTWRLVLDVPMFEDVIASPSGEFLAVAPYPDGPYVWRSTDGASWSRLASANAFGAGTIASLRSTQAGFVAVGWAPGPDAADGSPTFDAAAWTSGDAKAWTRAPDQASLRLARMADVAYLGGRLVAVGANEAGDGSLAWTSTDGLTWQRVTEPALSVDVQSSRSSSPSPTACSLPDWQGSTRRNSAHGHQRMDGPGRGSGRTRPDCAGVELEAQDLLQISGSRVLAVGIGSTTPAFHVGPLSWLVPP